MTSQPDLWSDLSVFITGHTGFKGGWLSIWLKSLGSRVHGYGLIPKTAPALFEVAHIREMLDSEVRGDVRDSQGLLAALQKAQPAVVFHLAAQPLVLESYQDPLGTFTTNVIGTANLLEAVRLVDSVRAVVVVTTDKVYDNREWPYPYREIDPLGGHDPYSASKAAAEMVAASYRSSFLANRPASPVQLATARAGNVIGGGDWAENRLIPDCLRAFEGAQPVQLRYPDAVRPWQHVLESLAGYIRLAEKLCGPDPARYASAWNFGPSSRGTATVGKAAQVLAALWGQGATVEMNSGEAFHEAGTLMLDSSRACNALNWRPRWGLQRALEATLDWQKAFLRGEDMRAKCLGQILEYSDSPGADP